MQIVCKNLMELSHVPNLMDSRNDIHVTFLLSMLTNRIELFHLATMSDSRSEKMSPAGFRCLVPGASTGASVC